MGTTAQVSIREVESSWPTDLAAVEIEALQDNHVEGGEEQISLQILEQVVCRTPKTRIRDLEARIPRDVD